MLSLGSDIFLRRSLLSRAVKSRVGEFEFRPDLPTMMIKGWRRPWHHSLSVIKLVFRPQSVWLSLISRQVSLMMLSCLDTLVLKIMDLAGVKTHQWPVETVHWLALIWLHFINSLSYVVIWIVAVTTSWGTSPMVFIWGLACLPIVLRHCNLLTLIEVSLAHYIFLMCATFSLIGFEFLAQIGLVIVRPLVDVSEASLVIGSNITSLALLVWLVFTLWQRVIRQGSLRAMWLLVWACVDWIRSLPILKILMLAIILLVHYSAARHFLVLLFF